MALSELDSELAAVPGTVSVWCGRIGAPPAYEREAHATHYAASTMKVAVLAALYRSAERGLVALDTPVPVRNKFDSAAPDAPRFGCVQEDDNDDEVWARIGGVAPLDWLARRMIVKSSNLATNHVIGQVGLPAVAEVWRLAGARHSITGRGIEDFAAREAGITNLVTAADLAALLGTIAAGADVARPAVLASPQACRSMLDVLCAQEQREDLAAGLPAGTRIAHKNGWVRGIRHGAGVVFPEDAPPYTVVACTTTTLAASDHGGDEACRLVARVAAASWADRHRLTP
jgi:beta-lactamase class A